MRLRAGITLIISLLGIKTRNFTAFCDDLSYAINKNRGKNSNFSVFYFFVLQNLLIIFRNQQKNPCLTKILTIFLLPKIILKKTHKQ